MQFTIRKIAILVLAVVIALILTILVDIVGSFIFGTDWNTINNYVTFILIILALFILIWTRSRKA